MAPVLPPALATSKKTSGRSTRKRLVRKNSVHLQHHAGVDRCVAGRGCRRQNGAHLPHARLAGRHPAVQIAHQPARVASGRRSFPPNASYSHFSGGLPGPSDFPSFPSFRHQKPPQRSIISISTERNYRDSLEHQYRPRHQSHFDRHRAGLSPCAARRPCPLSHRQRLTARRQGDRIRLWGETLCPVAVHVGYSSSSPAGYSGLNHEQALLPVPNQFLAAASRRFPS